MSLTSFQDNVKTLQNFISFPQNMTSLRGRSYQRFLRTNIGSRNLYSTKVANLSFPAFVQSFDLRIRTKSAPPHREIRDAKCCIVFKKANMNLCILAQYVKHSSFTVASLRWTKDNLRNILEILISCVLAFVYSLHFVSLC